MATGAAIKWSQAHTDAHDALVSMGIPKKEAQALVEGISGIDSGEILSQALQARGRQNKRLETPRGAPRGAVPLNAPSATESAATAAVTPAPTPQKRSPSPVPEPAIPAAQRLAMPRQNWAEVLGRPEASRGPARAPMRPAERPAMPSAPETESGESKDIYRRLASELYGTPSQTPRPAAPSAPEAQLTPPPAPISAPAQPAEKPRFRVPLVSYPTPAPLGGSVPSAQAPPSAPPAPEVAAQPQPAEAPRPQVATPGQAPDIYTLEEYAKLAPGTLFRWMGEGAHRGRLFVAHMNPTAPRQQVFGKAPQA